MTSKKLNVTVRERKQDGSSIFEGVAQLDGGTSFKLTKSRSDETRFTTRSSLTQSAGNFARRYGLELNLNSNATAKAAGQTTATNGKKSKTVSRSSKRSGHPTSLASDSVIV